MRRLTATILAALMFGAPSAFAAGKKKDTAPASSSSSSSAAPATGAAAAPAGGDDFGFDIVETAVTDTDKQKVEDAKDLVSQEKYGEALGAMEAIIADPKLKKFHDQMQYEMCKAYYKMDAYHASLDCFQKILEAGPKHAMYGQTRQWLFFIARKVKDELAALRLIARYAKAEDIPAEYQSELGYSLGRYYFLTALELGAKGVEVEQKADDTPVEDKGNSGALDIENKGDEGKDKGDKGEGKGKDKKDKKDEKKDDNGGFNFSDQDLGGGDVDLQGIDIDLDAGSAKTTTTKKKDAGKKAAASSKDAKGKGKEKESAKAKEEAAKAEEAKAAAPAEEKAAPKEDRGFEGPQTADEALKLSLDNLGRVKQDFPQYAQAVYIKGLVHFTKGEFQPAVKEFQNVVRLTNPKSGKFKNQKLREMAFFSLARIHYQFEQFRYAIFYYDRVDRDSEQWLEALFESSWAHFRLGEYQKALGNLVTLQSPFFQDEYYPEAAILKAITFYENCRYKEARAFLGEFDQNYGGVLKELVRLIGDDPNAPAAAAKDAKGAAVKTGPKTATQLFDELEDLEKKVKEGRDDQNRSFAITARLLRLALSDKRVKQYREAIDEVDDEKKKLAALSPPYAGGQTQKDALASIDARRADLVASAGGFLRDKLQAERAFLQDLNSKLIRIQFEITKGEKENLEAELQGQKSTTKTEDYRDLTAVDDERLYWPFEGEYWRDELGTYQYTLTRGCKPPSDTTITGN